MSSSFQDFRSVAGMQPSSAVELTQSADDVAGNDDLLRVIHLRLPLNSLTRFKSVSKHWLSLISDLQSSLLFKPSSALFLQSFGPDREFAAVPVNDYDCAVDLPESEYLGQPDTKIEHSSNGLLCYSKSTNYPDRTLIEYFVCNPTTNRSAKIPVHGTLRSRRMRRSFFDGGPTILYKLCDAESGDGDQQIIHVLGVYVAFDPLRSTHYRVLCVSEFSGDLFNYQIRIAVYKPELASWSEQLGPFTVPYAMDYSNGVYWNRGMFWADKTKVACFFLAGEFLKVAAMPQDSGKPLEVDYFGVSRDHLMAVVREKSSWNGVLKVYEMGKAYSGWVFRYQCDVHPLIDANVVRDVYSSFPLVFVAGGNEEDGGTRLVLGVHKGVVLYNLKSKTWKMILDFPSTKPPSWSWMVPFNVFPFDQTLCHL